MFEQKLAALIPQGFQIKVSKRKSIGLYVLPDTRVELRLPRRCSQAQVLAFVEANQSWLQQAQRQASVKHAKLQAFWLPGSEHYVLGVKHLLELADRNSPQPSELPSLTLYLSAEQLDSDKVKRALADYYRQLLVEQLDSLLPPMLAALAELDLPQQRYQGYKLRRMKRRWGSCSNRGQLNFNTWLARFDPELIEFVVAHEVSHLTQLNHSPAFYACLDRLLPDWRAREQAFLAHPAYHAFC